MSISRYEKLTNQLNNLALAAFLADNAEAENYWADHADRLARLVFGEN